jgi:hypothetical protein
MSLCTLLLQGILLPGPAAADDYDDIGFGRLQARLGAANPTGAGVLVVQAEGTPVVNGVATWAHDPETAEFSGSSTLAITRTWPPQSSRLCRSSFKMRFTRCAPRIARCRSAGVRVSAALTPLPRPALARHGQGSVPAQTSPDGPRGAIAEFSGEAVASRIAVGGHEGRAPQGLCLSCPPRRSHM